MQRKSVLIELPKQGDQNAISYDITLMYFCESSCGVFNVIELSKRYLV